MCDRLEARHGSWTILVVVLEAVDKVGHLVAMDGVVESVYAAVLGAGFVVIVAVG